MTRLVKWFLIYACKFHKHCTLDEGWIEVFASSSSSFELIELGSILNSSSSSSSSFLLIYRVDLERLVKLELLIERARSSSIRDSSRARMSYARARLGSFNSTIWKCIKDVGPATAVSAIKF